MLLISCMTVRTACPPPLKSEEDWSKFGDILDKLMKKEN